ncbi:MAG: 30S ribosomal protein S18 [Elusimicrobia bacterium CG11_big_fil_rev_8_21_14_0_20_64_6]|nr:MAG: 30S ribosomal protein S18 [Elusimicrobia bacterium CG11_big_fil_rev_8_21_14_0_20_64_6]
MAVDPTAASSAAPVVPAGAPALAASSSSAPAARRPSSGGRRAPYPVRRKVCRFCAEKVRDIDFKQIQILRTFTTDMGKILSARITGNCASHQRQLTRCIKRARNLALLPYVTR